MSSTSEKDNILIQLKSLSGVQNIQKLKQGCYTLTYQPKDIKNLYQEIQFSIKLIVQQNYPIKSPEVYFIHIPYHINIDQKNGKLYLSLLEQDWCPFFKLQRIFQEIKIILQKPDLDKPANISIKRQYLENQQKYLEKVQNFVFHIKSKITKNQQNIIYHKNNEPLVKSQKFINQRLIYQNNYFPPTMTSPPLKSMRSHSRSNSSKKKIKKNVKQGYLGILKDKQMRNKCQKSIMNSDSNPSSKSQNSFSKKNLQCLRTFFKEKYMQNVNSPLNIQEQDKFTHRIQKIQVKHIQKSSDEDNLYSQRTLKKFNQKQKSPFIQPQIKQNQADNYIKISQNQRQRLSYYQLSFEQPSHSIQFYKQSLKQINSYIQNFIKECKQIEQRLLSANNNKFKQILIRKLQNNAGFIQELENVALKMKKKIVQSLKKEVKNAF